MKGKVFETSKDVYQDQAKVLFDYYLDAATKIVSQEDEVDKQLKDLDLELLSTGQLTKETKKNYIIGAAFFVVGIILAIVVMPIVFVVFIIAAGYFAYQGYISYGRMQERINEIEEKKQECFKIKNNIFKDYKVNKIGVVYVPVAKRVVFGDKSVVLDLTESVAPTRISLQVANHPSALVKTLKDLETLSTEAPIIEKSKQVESVETSAYSSSIQDVKLYDYFGTMDRTLRTGAYYLSDVSTKNIDVPFILPKSKQMDYLNQYATTDVENDIVVPVFQKNRFDREMDEFQKINEFQAQFAQENKDFEIVLKQLIANIGVAVQTVATMKIASNNKLIDSSNQLLFTILKNSYNHYSPFLEHEEIEKIRNTNFNYSDTVENYKPFQLKESSRVKYDAQTGNWVAEDGTITTMPFGISQIQEEIVAPIVQNLLAETRMERMRIYNDIRNQKINYLNKWHQDTEDFYGRNRTSSDDLLNIMRSNMTKFLAAQATIESVADIKKSMRSQMLAGKKSEGIEGPSKSQDDTTLAAFEVQSQQFKKAQEDFDEYMDRLKDDIDDRARNFEYIEYYDASLRDRLAKDLVSAGDNQDQLEVRRRPLASINPLYAQASVLPPSPSVSESVREQLSMNVARYASTTLDELNEGKSVLISNETAKFEKTVQTEETLSREAPQQQVIEEVKSSTGEEESIVENIIDTLDDKALYALKLVSVGTDSKLVVNSIKETFGISTDEAQQLVSEAPCMLVEGLLKSEAVAMKNEIEAHGAKMAIIQLDNDEEQ